MSPTPTQSAREVDTPLFVEGVVIEVLKGFGLAHVRSDAGATLGITRRVAGTEFDALVEGQRVRLLALRKFNRVLGIERITP